MTVPDRAASLTLVVILLLAAVPFGSATGVAHASGASTEERSAIAPEELPDADTTVTRIELEDDGTASWSVTIRTRLANESEVSEYEAFQEQFRADRDAHVDRFEERMTGVVSSAADSTGRTMTATEFDAETSIQELPRRWGIVTFSFRWTGFAAAEGDGDGDAVVVGDVFEGGLYLGDDDLLEIEPPEGYAPATTSPPPDEREGSTVVWTGPADFSDQEPAVRFEPTGESASESTTDAERSDAGRWLSPTLVGATALAVVALVGIAFAVVADRETLAGLGSRVPIPTESSATTADETAEAPTAADGSERSVPDPESPADADSGAGSDGDAAADPNADSGSDVEPESESSSTSDPESPLDPDLLTDEDRVRRLLERNDGRMRQAAIAEELEWSASKTSRVVSGMAEDETVEKLRIGRENVIDLADDSD